ncbi:MAG: hypothetical protein HY064_01970 [Bacteroidetes bacterium]|nr:hypothetical protein [Bacteroidota bacterium]
MRSLFVILFFLSCSILPAQNDTLNRIDSAGKKQGYFIITGKMKNDKSFADSAIVEEGNYVNSSRTGVWTSYYPSGGKKSEMTYVNNRPNAPMEKWNSTYK